MGNGKLKENGLRRIGVVRRSLTVKISPLLSESRIRRYAMHGICTNSRQPPSR